MLFFSNKSKEKEKIFCRSCIFYAESYSEKDFHDISRLPRIENEKERKIFCTKQSYKKDIPIGTITEIVLRNPLKINMNNDCFDYQKKHWPSGP